MMSWGEFVIYAGEAIVLFLFSLVLRVIVGIGLMILAIAICDLLCIDVDVVMLRTIIIGLAIVSVLFPTSHTKD